MNFSILFLTVLAASPASARQEMVPLVSPGFVAGYGEKPAAFGLGAGFASFDGTGHSLSGPIFSWTLRHRIGKDWALFLGSDAAILSGTSESGAAGRVHALLGGASARGMLGKEFPLGSGMGTLAFGLAAPFTISNYQTSLDITVAGKRSSLTPDTAFAIAVGLPVSIVVSLPLGESWTLRPHALAVFWPTAGILYTYAFLGPFSPRRSESVGPYMTLEGGLAAFHHSGLGLTSRLQWTSSAGATAATRMASAGLAYEFGFGK